MFCFVFVYSNFCRFLDYVVVNFNQFGCDFVEFEFFEQWCEVYFYGDEVIKDYGFLGDDNGIVDFVGLDVFNVYCMEEFQCVWFKGLNDVEVFVVMKVVGEFVVVDCRFEFIGDGGFGDVFDGFGCVVRKYIFEWIFVVVGGQGYGFVMSFDEG